MSNYKISDKIINDLYQLQNEIINKRNEFENILIRCKDEKNNFELEYNNLLSKKKELSASEDIKSLVKIDRQLCEELKSLMTQIDEQETTLINLKNETKKFSELDKPYFSDNSHFAKEITGIEWTLQSNKVKGYIKNKQNLYLKYFSIKDNTDVTEQLYKEIEKSASSNWDDFVNEAL